MTEFYKSLNAQLAGLIEGVPHTVANLANASALLWQGLDKINWAGFYLFTGEKLVLGPFQGKPACIEIPMGKGVCGTSASRGEAVVVEDVHKFKGHIACDCDSASEIVVPIYLSGKLFGVLDIDSPVVGRFSENDREGLEEFVKVLEKELECHLQG